jgi:hypothetical protein
MAMGIAHRGGQTPGLKISDGFSVSIENTDIGFIAHSMALDIMLATNNEHEFKKMPICMPQPQL